MPRAARHSGMWWQLSLSRRWDYIEKSVAYARKAELVGWFQIMMPAAVTMGVAESSFPADLEVQAIPRLLP